MNLDNLRGSQVVIRAAMKQNESRRQRGVSVITGKPLIIEGLFPNSTLPDASQLKPVFGSFESRELGKSDDRERSSRKEPR